MARRKKVTSKQCAMTGITFPTNEFYANNNSKDGLSINILLLQYLRQLSGETVRLADANAAECG